MARSATILAALFTAAIISLMTNPAPAAEDGVIRIGMTLRMIVENGIKYGQLTSAELNSINDSGGINGHKVQVILLDDECNAQKGVANTNRFIEQDRVHLIVGSICSSVTIPMVDITARAQVPQITPTATARPITEKGSAWIFRNSASERYFAAVHAKYLAEHAGKKVAYLYTTDAAGISFVTQYQQFMKETYEVEPVYSAQQQETDLDFRSNLLKIKSLSPDVLALAGQSDAIARIVTQALEVGIPRKVARVSASAASNAPVPETAGDAVIGLIFSAAFVCTDPRPEAQAFVKLVQEKYQVRCPDHDWAQAYSTAQIVKEALKRAGPKLKLTDASLAEDRTAIRDAFAGIRDFQGVVPGKISFCADPTPQCRDGNRTPILVEYTKGGKDYEMKQLATVTFDPDFGLKK
jgi:branched-chain amino acid transport system substrate-binding protein